MDPLPVRPSRSILVYVAVAAVIVVVTALSVRQLMVRAEVGATAGPGRPVPTLPPATEPPVLPAVSVHEGPVVPGAPQSPTAHKAQSKLWHHDGLWWALMIDAGTGGYMIHRLDPGTQRWVNTGTLVDERHDANPDSLWDGEALIVASAGISSGARAAARIGRYLYDADLKVFENAPDFPVQITEHGVESIVVTRDSTGTLWVSYVFDGRVIVDHSIGNDAIWASPYALPFAEAVVGPDDIATVVSYGDRVGLAWSNQPRNAVYFASHRDGDPVDAWTAPEVPVQGLGMADDHLHAKATSDGRILIAAKTSQDELPNRNSQAPLTLLMTRGLDGRWSTAVFGQVRDRHTRPIALIDESAGRVYMFAASPGTGGVIYGKVTEASSPAFAGGRGEVVIESPSDPVVADPTSTKQAVDARDGFVILAFDGSTSRYVHAWVGGQPVGPTPSGPGDSPAPSPITAATTLIHDTFDPWPAGSPVTNGWALRAADVAQLAIAAQPDERDRSARLVTSIAERDARTCKGFAPTATGRLSVDIRTRLEGLGTSDATIVGIRGDRADIASVRYGQAGRFAYYDGTTKVRTETTFGVRAWYRTQVIVDLAAKRYSFSIRDDAGTVVLRANGLRWRNDASQVDEVCLQTSSGRAGLGLYFDDAIVARR